MSILTDPDTKSSRERSQYGGVKWFLMDSTYSITEIAWQSGLRKISGIRQKAVHKSKITFAACSWRRRIVIPDPSCSPPAKMARIQKRKPVLMAKCQQERVGVDTWWWFDMLGDHNDDYVYLPFLNGPGGTHNVTG